MSRVRASVVVRPKGAWASELSSQDTARGGSIHFAPLEFAITRYEEAHFLPNGRAGDTEQCRGFADLALCLPNRFFDLHPLRALARFGPTRNTNGVVPENYKVAIDAIVARMRKAEAFWRGEKILFGKQGLSRRLSRAGGQAHARSNLLRNFLILLGQGWSHSAMRGADVRDRIRSPVRRAI